MLIPKGAEFSADKGKPPSFLDPGILTARILAARIGCTRV